MGFLYFAESLVIGGLCGYYVQDSKKNARNQKLISCVLKLVSSKLLAELTVWLGIALEFWHGLCAIKFLHRTLEGERNTFTIIKTYIFKALPVFLGSHGFGLYTFGRIGVVQLVKGQLGGVVAQWVWVGFFYFFILNLPNVAVRPAQIGDWTGGKAQSPP